MKSISIILFFILTVFQCFSQTPDTVIYEHNFNSPDDVLNFSFIHLTDVHIGEADPDGDFGTAGYNDTLTTADTGAPITALSYAVKWINQNAEALKIKFVIVSGDLTDSGELSEFFKFKQIIDSLKIPYIPLIGNHDIWQYTGSEEAPTPDGDSIINEIFASQFDSLNNFFSQWDDGTRLIPTYNTEANCTSRFQNFSFVYDNYLFVLCDFVTRNHAPFGEPGVGPEANLMDFPGGSFYWFKQKMLSYPDKGDKNIFIISHHPPTKEPTGTASFSYGEYDQITQFLDTLRQHIAAWFAGHLHRTSVYGITKWIPDGTITTGVETDADKEFPYGHFRIVNVYAPPLDIEEREKPVLSIFPNPNNGVLNILFRNPEKESDDIEIFDVLGKSVYKKELRNVNNQLNLSHLNNGIYILKSRNLQRFYKIVVSKTL